MRYDLNRQDSNDYRKTEEETRLKKSRSTDLGIII